MTKSLLKNLKCLIRNPEKATQMYQDSLFLGEKIKSLEAENPRGGGNESRFFVAQPGRRRFLSPVTFLGAQRHSRPQRTARPTAGIAPSACPAAPGSLDLGSPALHTEGNSEGFPLSPQLNTEPNFPHWSFLWHKV